MFPSATSTSISEEASISSEIRFNSLLLTHDHQPPESKKKRSQPGNPDPDAQVVALSPRTLLATNRFVCEICKKGFQRDQNLQLHRRGHNLPWRLRQRSGKEVIRKRVYVCPETSCVHHHPSRALGDLTGIKKHFCRKHGEKKWKCDKCSKKYAVHSDWKAHAKTCGTREYRCDCGTLFSRKDSFITHRAFCDALAEESARLIANTSPPLHQPDHFLPFSTSWNPPSNPNPNLNFLSNPNPNPNSNATQVFHVKKPVHEDTIHTIFHPQYLPSHHHLLPAAAAAAPHMSATTLLQRASAMGRLPPTSTAADRYRSYDAATAGVLPTCQRDADRLTRDFLGFVSSDVAGDELIPLAGLGLDLVPSFACSPGGDQSKALPGFGFPPAAGAWGDY